MIRLLTLTLLLCMGLGCRAREQADSLQPTVTEPTLVEAVQRATHRSVADPPRVEGHEPVLWVALADHLGAAETAAPLNLRAFAGSLSLRDATGEQGIDSGFVISWRSVAKTRPLKLARRIAGPYASFESADRVASRWRALGVAAEVAHPKDWEVWAPEGSPVPDGLAVRDWHGQFAQTPCHILIRQPFATDNRIHEVPLNGVTIAQSDIVAPLNHAGAPAFTNEPLDREGQFLFWCSFLRMKRSEQARTARADNQNISIVSIK